MYLQRNYTSLVFAAALIIFMPLSVFAASASQVTLNFMCPCGTCDEALSTCECPQSDGFRAEIAGMVGQGYSEEQIIQNFTGRFGPSVLITNAAMAPGSETRGFDKRTIGFLFLIASFSLVAFSLGRYMKPATSSAPARRSRKNSPKAPHQNTRAKSEGKGKSQNRRRDSVDEELLDDYDY